MICVWMDHSDIDGEVLVSTQVDIPEPDIALSRGAVGHACLWNFAVVLEMPACERIYCIASTMVSCPSVLLPSCCLHVCTWSPCASIAWRMQAEFTNRVIGCAGCRRAEGRGRDAPGTVRSRGPVPIRDAHGLDAREDVQAAGLHWSCKRRRCVDARWGLVTHDIQYISELRTVFVYY